MHSKNTENVRARLIAEYIDEAEPGPTPTPASAEVQRPKHTFHFEDASGTEPCSRLKDFTIQFKAETPPVTVRGHELKKEGQDYMVVLHEAGREVVVAYACSGNVLAITANLATNGNE